jgi:hypothetical protein
MTSCGGCQHCYKNLSEGTEKVLNREQWTAQAAQPGGALSSPSKLGRVHSSLLTKEECSSKMFCHQTRDTSMAL